MTVIKDKIKAVRVAANMSRRELSDRIGIGESKIQNVESGHQRADYEFISTIIKFFELDANWLMNDELGMQDIATNTSEFLPIPRYDVAVSAGDGATAQDTQITGFYGFKRDWIKRNHLDPDNLSVVIVTGNSMTPHLSDGDLVLIDHSQNKMVDGRTFVLRSNSELFVKNMQLAPNDTLLLISTNKEYPPISIDLKKDGDSITIIGRVVASMHDWL